MGHFIEKFYGIGRGKVRPLEREPSEVLTRLEWNVPMPLSSFIAIVVGQFFGVEKRMLALSRLIRIGRNSGDSIHVKRPDQRFARIFSL